MAASEAVENASTGPSQQFGEDQARSGRSARTFSLVRRTKFVGLLAIAASVLLYVFPPFRIVSLKPRETAPPVAGAAMVFDPVAAAARLWETDLPAAAQRAIDVKTLADSLRENLATAKTKFARSADFGAAYYFVRGSGKVIARDRNQLRVALDGMKSEIVALRIGPIFGNTVRDGCGLLDVNSFPGLQEFNALSAELNTLVEKNVLPMLRDRANIGSTVEFAGCAEAPENAASEGEPLLLIVPVQTDVR
jgi:predicted lipoprotein